MRYMTVQFFRTHGVRAEDGVGKGLKGAVVH